MNTRRVMWVLLILASLAVGIGIGLVLAGGDSRRSEPGMLANLPPKHIEGLLNCYRGMRNTKAFGLLTRSNAYAAEALVRLRKSGIAARMLIQAYGGGPDNRGSVLLSAIELGAYRSAVVLMFQDEQGRLVHYAHPKDVSVFGGFAGIPMERGALARLGRLSDDGIVYIEASAFQDEPDRLRIPDGEVAVGLKYPDGSYSNFILLERSR